MKIIIMLVSAIAVIFASCNETSPEDITVFEDYIPYYRMPIVLNGKVKTYKMRTYWPQEKDGKIVKGDIITQPERDSLNYISDFNLEIDENGFPTRVEYIIYDTTINHNEFDIAGKRIVGERSLKDGEQSSYFIEEYNESGQGIKEYLCRFGADTLINSCDVSYLENGKKDEWICYDQKNEKSYTHRYIWKDTSLIAEHLIYNPDDSTYYTMKLGYNEDGNWKSATFYYPDEGTSLFEIRDLKLDYKGNMAPYLVCRNDTLLTITEYLIEYYQDQKSRSHDWGFYPVLQVDLNPVTSVKSQ